MDASQIHDHWTQWATQYGADLRATTKSSTPKVLELEALSRHLRAILGGRSSASVLEVGCGNGVNCLALAQALPKVRFDGVDFVREMVTAANESARSTGQANLRFFEGNAAQLDAVVCLESRYDVVFTDRCLINLNTLELQLRALTGLAARLHPDGHLVLIENSMTTYNEQNRCRQILGLPARTPASYNLFFDEDAVRTHVAGLGLELVQVEDFITLHDLVLYVLVPAINGGTVDYEHPLVKAATTLSAGISASKPSAFGAFGQNRLFHWRKPG
jgi:SAM-dependent methyltransferase